MNNEEVNKILRVAFKLPPKEALDYLNKRGKILKLSAGWSELSASAHEKAFTVSKVMSADVLQTIFNHLKDCVAKGKDVEHFKKTLSPRLEEAGWLGKVETVDPITGEILQTKMSPSRLKLIFNTNISVQQMRGKYEAGRIAPTFKYAQYLPSRSREKRDSHKHFYYKVFKLDDPIWKKIWPPKGFGCQCDVRLLRESDLARLGLKVENGADYDKYVDPDDLNSLNPLTAWEPHYDKYNEDIKLLLKSSLKNKN